MCAIPGDEHIFSVKINSNEPVSELKRKVMRESPELGDLAAKTLDLFKINVGAPDEQKAIKEIETLGRTLKNADRLNPVLRLNKVFQCVPDDKIHILVKLPEGESIDSRACGVAPNVVPIQQSY